MIVLEAFLIASVVGSTAARQAPVAIDSAIAVPVSGEPARADTGLLRFMRIPIDTPPPRTRPRAIQISDWYSRRLTIHRYTAYATIPVFAAQWIAGNQLLQESRAAPEWAKVTHRAGATALAGMFTVNTVTGLWNWWDSRALSQHRALRTVHAFTMIACDAAFSYTGAKLSNDAETSNSARHLHHQVALISMGVTVLSGTAMKIWNK